MPATAMLNESRLQRVLGGGQIGIVVVWAGFIAGVWAGAWRLGDVDRLAWAAVASWLAWLMLRGVIRWRRQRYIREGPMPAFLRTKLRGAFPELSAKDCELVERGLRQFFLAGLNSRRKAVAMPSQVVDAMWHEFILHTRAYRAWCHATLGWFMHHTPAEIMGRDPKRNDALRRTWYWACRDESIQPQRPTRLPLLFALDTKLKIPGGFAYVPDCGTVRRASEGTPNCASDFSSSSFGGSGSDFGGADTSSHRAGDGDGGSGSSSDSSGCGGSGCGGGGD